MQIIQTNIGYPCAKCGAELIVFGNDVGHVMTCQKCGQAHNVTLQTVKPGWSEVVIKPI